MTLPTQKTKPITDLSKQVILIYGRPKIGKSALCAQFPDALFLATEPGLSHLAIFKTNITSWEEFLQECSSIAAGKHEFRTIIIDTVDSLVTYCNEWVCKCNNVNHVSEIDNNMGWHLATSELNRILVKLSALPYGLVLVSHATQITIKTKTKSYDRFTIDIGGKSGRAILAKMDLILFMDSDIDSDGKEVGCIRSKPSLYWEAGDRSKLLPETIVYPLQSPEIAYNAIWRAFQKNGQGQDQSTPDRAS